MKKKEFNLTAKQISTHAIFLLIGLICGTLVGFFMLNRQDQKRDTNYLDSKFGPLYEAYDILKEKYYNELDDKELVNGSIRGMLDSIGDKHTMFFDEKEKESFETELSSSYYGIGAQIASLEDGNIIVTKVFDDSPAAKAGIKPGDIFVSIDGKSVKGKTADDVATNLRGKSKEKATIVMKRDNKEITFEITQDIVTLLSVSSEMIDNDIGLISVSLFGESTDKQFEEALIKLEKDGMKTLIIDLRDNGGGYLSTVTNMISEFVDRNTVIYQIKDHDNIQKFASVSNTKRNIKVIILVNENSASASEIMCSALQEQYNATLVGVTTYGKGTVQQTSELSNKTLIKYTIEEWLTSKGNSIDGKGVKPNVEVELSEKYKENPIRENDNQLQKAIELAK